VQEAHGLELIHPQAIVIKPHERWDGDRWRTRRVRPPPCVAPRRCSRARHLPRGGRRAGARRVIAGQVEGQQL
jgi:hypothetical protein